MVAAVGALPERQRDALVLRELEGRSYDEIALKLGISDGAVRQLLNRARNSLRAGVSALTPYGLLARIPEGADEPIVSRIAELTAAGAGAGTVATKVAATALVTGAVVGGVAAVPEDGRSSEPPRAEAAVGKARQQARMAVATAHRAVGPTSRARRGPRDTDRPGASRNGDGRTGDDGDSRWRGGDDEDRREDRSGPGSEGDEPRGDSSGPGPGRSSGSDSDGDSSGPGSGGASGSGGGD